VYVTCLCDPEAVPDIPNSVVTIERPSARGIVERFVRGRTAGTHEDGEHAPISIESADVDAIELGRLPPPAPQVNEKDVATGKGLGPGPTSNGGKFGLAEGGVAVCVAGPASLVREVTNAVARVGTVAGFGTGGISLHAEVYSL
jgi:ferric-chelate reductase